MLSVTPNDCVVTNPRVCVAIADFLNEHGLSDIALAEGSTCGVTNTAGTIEGFKNNGYADYEHKWRMVDLNNDEAGQWFRTYSPGLDFEAELGIAETVTEGFVISAAKFKTHDVLGLTLSLKNMMDSICKVRNASTGKTIANGGKTKTYMHGFGEKGPSKLPREITITSSKVALAANILRLVKRVKPGLTVIDGLVAMEGNGPLNGSKKELNIENFDLLCFLMVCLVSCWIMRRRVLD